MAVKITDGNFKDKVKDNLQDDFMRGAVSGAQDRLRSRRLENAEELGNWEEWRSHGKRFANMCWKI